MPCGSRSSNKLSSSNRGVNETLAPCAVAEFARTRASVAGGRPPEVWRLRLPTAARGLLLGFEEVFFQVHFLAGPPDVDALVFRGRRRNERGDVGIAYDAELPVLDQD